MKGVSALNVYKKVAIIRRSTDVLSYEDADGNIKTISDLHTAAVATTPLNQAKPKSDIPVPKIRDVETYKTDIPPNYGCPLAYVRHIKPSHNELRDNLEYVIDAEDEVWLLNNSKFGGASVHKKVVEKKPDNNATTATSTVDVSKQQQPPPEAEKVGTVQLPLNMLEIMMDVLEKATAFDAIITMDQTETLVLKKLPALYHMYPIKARAGVVTIKHVLTDVYNYWVSKRSKLKRPLLRRFWPVTSSDDTNPHLVFRPREKEKYKLRRKRQNDMDGYRKLQQLKQDFQQVRALLELVKQREEINKAMIMLQREWFRQKIYDAVDTSGEPRVAEDLDLPKMKQLLKVPQHFDVSDSWRKNKKARRGSQTGKSSRSSSPVPEVAAAEPGATTETKPPQIVAGQNHGEPAPNFLQPLTTREHYTTNWDSYQPHVTSYVDSHPEPTFRFRHRPRVGRGGRICIDRMPLPIDPNFAPTTFFRAGNSQIHPNEPKQSLLDVLPKRLDQENVSRRIEEICMSALKDDYDAQSTAGPPMTTALDAEENDGEVVVVKMADWLKTDDQLWGEERFSLGPL